jgi:hypothetical protein
LKSRLIFQRFDSNGAKESTMTNIGEIASDLFRQVKLEVQCDG